MSRIVDYCAFAFAFFYSFLCPLVGNRDVDAGVRLFLYNGRNFAIVAFTIVFLVGVAVTDPRRYGRIGKAPWALFTCALVFVFYHVIVVGLRGDGSLIVSGLYLAWAVFAFVVAPLVYCGRQSVKTIVGALLAGNLASWGISYILDPTFSHSFFVGRLSLGFSNPNYYAQVPQVVLICAAFFIVQRAKKNKVATAPLVIMIAGSLALMVLARSRNTLVFVIVAAFVYLAQAARQRLRVVGLVALAACLTLGVSFIGYLEMGDVNELSSNRLSYWSRLTAHVFRATDHLESVLFGVSTEVTDQASGRGYDDLRSEKLIKKAHFDNFYIELLVEGGVVGLLLFVLPYAWCARLGSRAFGPVFVNRRIAYWYIGVLAGVAAQGLFVATFPSFNNAIGFALAWLLSCPAAQGNVVRTVYPEAGASD